MIGLAFKKDHREIVRQYQITSLKSALFQRHMDKRLLVTHLLLQWDTHIGNLSYN